MEFADIVREARLILERQGEGGSILPYSAVVADEVQDFSPEDLSPAARHRARRPQRHFRRRRRPPAHLQAPSQASAAVASTCAAGGPGG